MYIYMYSLSQKRNREVFLDTVYDHYRDFSNVSVPYDRSLSLSKKNGERKGNNYVENLFHPNVPFVPINYTTITPLFLRSYYFSPFVVDYSVRLVVFNQE